MGRPKHLPMMTQRQIARTPILYLGLGFVGGVIISRNAAPMTNAETAAVIFGLIICTFFAWRSGIRGKNEAVAVAVATATATAVAQAEASAKAVATQAVQIVLGTDYLPADGQRFVESRQQSLDEAHEYISGINFAKEARRVRAVSQAD